MTLLDSINIGGNTYGITGAAVLGASSTPAGSEVKVCTFTDGFELKAGNLFLIKFTYANTYGDGSTTYPKLQINGTNYVMRRADGNYVQSGEWGNNATLTFLFDGTDFILPAGSATGSTGVPLGSVIAIYSNSVPDGYLPCNGVQFDPAQFAALYALLGDDHTPDLRECALVGIGENASDTIASHDVYTLGQFKDDQIQSHSHNIYETGHPERYAVNTAYPGASGWPVTSSEVTVNGLPILEAGSIKSGRNGSVTRGKRKGVNYIIKATSGLPDSQQDYILNQLAPVDEVTVNNMHSVTSNAVYKSINPPTTTIIESTQKRTVTVTAGQTTWWGMTRYPAPDVPTGKRLIRTFPRCSNNGVAVFLGNVYYASDSPAIATVSDSTSTVQIWLCIEVADI